jgi:hypothetical protein
LKRALAIPVLAASFGACTNFADPTTVVDLRVLAVKAEPSEIILDVDLSNPGMPVVDPANNPGIDITPLIADPAGNMRPVKFTITACPNDPFAPAPPGGGQGGGAFPSGGARTTVGSALCDENSDTTWVLLDQPADSGSTVTVYPTVPELTTAFMKDVFPDQYGNLHGGFDLGMPFTLDIKVDAGTEEIRAVKRVLYWAQRIDPGQTPNQTPQMAQLDAFLQRDETTFTPIDEPKVLDEMTPLEVPAGTTEIWIRPAPATAEPFWTTVIDPDTHQAVPFHVDRETLRYRFFATAGTFSPAVTSSEPMPGFMPTGPIPLESKLSLPSDTSGLPTDMATGKPLITIWVVGRDDRGGESWLQRQLMLTP